MNNLTDQSVTLILNYIDKLAVKLGIGTGEIFSWYVKQVWIDFYVQTLWIGFFSLLIIVFVLIGRHCNKKEEASDESKAKDETTDSSVAYIVALFFGAIDLIIIGGTLGYNVPKLLNINYHAFNDLISRLASAL